MSVFDSISGALSGVQLPADVDLTEAFYVFEGVLPIFLMIGIVVYFFKLVGSRRRVTTYKEQDIKDLTTALKGLKEWHESQTKEPARPKGQDTGIHDFHGKPVYYGSQVVYARFNHDGAVGSGGAGTSPGG